jgi:N-glycosidase YbiA
MCAGFTLKVNKKIILTSEALFQALKFSNYPEIQAEIMSKRSPIAAKCAAKKAKAKIRSDWNLINVEIMYWCLKVKLCQNMKSFGKLLESTNNKDIVEESNRDLFWDAVSKSKGSLTGSNVLGQLLMKLRNEYM